jgi:hypothetical protein
MNSLPRCHCHYHHRQNCHLHPYYLGSRSDSPTSLRPRYSLADLVQVVMLLQVQGVKDLRVYNLQQHNMQTALLGLAASQV